MSKNEVPPRAKIAVVANAQAATQTLLLVIDTAQAPETLSPQHCQPRDDRGHAEQVETHLMTVSAISAQQNGVQ